jgi:hypothetical protein
MNAKLDTIPITATVMSSCINEKPAWVVGFLRRFIRVLAVITPPRELKGRQNFPRPIEQRSCRCRSPVKSAVVGRGLALTVTYGDGEWKCASQKFCGTIEALSLYFGREAESALRDLKRIVRCGAVPHAAKQLGDKASR